MSWWSSYKRICSNWNSKTQHNFCNWRTAINRLRHWNFHCRKLSLSWAFIERSHRLNHKWHSIRKTCRKISRGHGCKHFRFSSKLPFPACYQLLKRCARVYSCVIMWRSFLLIVFCKHCSCSQEAHLNKYTRMDRDYRFTSVIRPMSKIHNCILSRV